jgi:uncharacterized membrane protein YdbT with pleckstrin-like domain
MADLLVRPTQKWNRLKYTIVFFVFAIAVGVYVNALQNQVEPWVLIVPALLFLWPISGGMRRRFTKIEITGDKLRYETGVLSKTTRTIQISKVQDVRIDQSFRQRLFGIGTLSIETAGETSRLTMEDIDEPNAVADAIVDASHGLPQPPKRKAAER